MLMATLRTVNTKDLELLLALDKRLHGITESTFKPNIKGSPFRASIDTYTDQSISPVEIEMVLKVIERGGFVFYPVNTSMGLAVGLHF